MSKGHLDHSMPRAAIALALVVCLFTTSPAAAGVSVREACEQVFERKTRAESETVNAGPRGRHGFRVKPAEVTRTDDGITVRGYFFHVISGRNDRVHYTIVVKKGGQYEATIDSIELGGLAGKDSKVAVGIQWTARAGGGLVGAKLAGVEGALQGAAVGDKVAEVALSAANKLQRKLIGNWSNCAPEILDGIAAYFAAGL